MTLPDFLSAELVAHLSGRNVNPDAFVFTAPTGGVPYHKVFYRRFFKPAVPRAGLPDRLRLHDLRHTCASPCIALSPDPEGDPGTARPLLDHGDFDRYGHLFPKLDEALTARLDELHQAAANDETQPKPRAENTVVRPLLRP